MAPGQPVHPPPPDRHPGDSTSWQYVRRRRANPFVVVSVRNPTVSLATDDRRERFVATVTDVVLKAAGMELERDRVYVNLIYGDMWGIGGQVYKDADF